MNLKKNDTGAPSNYEWTMSRYGKNGSYYHYWHIYYTDIIANIARNSYMPNKYSARPVFYLTSDIKIISGTGQYLILI